jgi:outer membrane lipoprotein-sorting protein
VRLELQSEEGDTEVIYDGRKLSIYDAATNTLYRYTPPAGERTGRSSEQPSSGEQHAPSVAKIEEAIGKLEHVSVSGATPGDVAGQPAYTVRVSPKEGGSLLGGAELSWDAENGVPLRAAIYSSKSSAAVIELASSEVSFGPVSSSVFEITPPASAKVEELKPATEPQAGAHGSDHQSATTHGSGVSAVEVIETKTKPGQKPTQLPEQLPKVKIGASTAAELSTALGTVLGFERAGASFLVFGALEPAQIEAVARGL